MTKTNARHVVSSRIYPVRSAAHRLPENRDPNRADTRIARRAGFRGVYGVSRTRLGAEMRTRLAVNRGKSPYLPSFCCVRHVQHAVSQRKERLYGRMASREGIICGDRRAAALRAARRNLSNHCGAKRVRARDRYRSRGRELRRPPLRSRTVVNSREFFSSGIALNGIREVLLCIFPGGSVAARHCA